MADHELPLPPSPDDPAPESPMRRWLIGCGCGCAVLLAVVTAGLFFLARTLMGPGTQLPSDHLLREDTVAAIQLDSPTTGADERAFLLEVLGSLVAGLLVEAEGAETDQDLRELLVMLEDLESSGGDFGPRSFTLVFAPDGDELGMAFAVNLDQGAPLMRYSLEFLALAGATEHERDGQVAYELDPGEATIETSTTVGGVETTERVDYEMEFDSSFFVGFVHDTAIFSDSKQLLLDTMVATDFEETPGAPPSSPLRRELDDLRTDWLLAAAMVDHPLLDPADLLAPGALADELDLSWTEAPYGAARLGVGVDGRDLALRLEVDGLDPADVDRVAEGFGILADAWQAQLGEQDLELAHEVIAGQTSLLVQVGLPELRTWIEERTRDQITIE